MLKNKFHTESFSLIEVLIFVAILSMFFILAVVIVTASLRQMQSGIHRTLATRYAQDLTHWLQTEKETDWNVFVARGSTTGKVYCFNWPLGTSWSSMTSSQYLTAYCSTNSTINYKGIQGTSPQIYNREVTLKTVGSPTVFRVDASVVVSWQELGVGVSVPIQTSYFTWE